MCETYLLDTNKRKIFRIPTIQLNGLDLGQIKNKFLEICNYQGRKLFLEYFDNEIKIPLLDISILKENENYILLEIKLKSEIWINPVKKTDF